MLTCDAGFCLEWAKLVIKAKIENSLAFISTVGGTYSYSPEETSGMVHSLRYLAQATSVGEAMGEYLVALGLVIIALQDRCYPEWIPAAS